MHKINESVRKRHIRKATPSDLPALTGIKPPMALHRDRIHDADGDDLLYLVIEENSNIIGFGLLVFRIPSTWPDPDDPSCLPALVDLFIKPNCRGLGAGSFLIDYMENIAWNRDSQRIFLEVDPVANPRAYHLYLRRGYVPIQKKPYKSHWEFTDSDGHLHEGDEWKVDMVKEFIPSLFL